MITPIPWQKFVYVTAFIWYGLHKVIFKDRIHAILDFNQIQTTTVDPRVTFQLRVIHCKINCSVSSVNFPKRKAFNEDALLVSSNIRDECVLGCDFITADGLTLRTEEHSGYYSSSIFSQLTFVFNFLGY